MSLRIKKLLPPVMSLLLLALALWWVGPPKLGQAVANFSPLAAMGMLLCSILNISSTNFRFFLLLKKLGGLTSFKDAYKANSIGQAAALFFIPLLAQVAARRRLIEKSGLPQISNAVIAMIERLSTALLSLTTAGFGFWWLVGLNETDNMLASVSLGEMAATIFVSATIYSAAAVSNSEKRILKLIFNFKIIKSSLPILLLTLASYLFIMASFSLAIKLTKPQISIIDTVAASAIISFAASIPVSVGGWGLREVAAIYVLKQVGIDEGPALLISISVGVLSMMATVLNAALCVTLRGRSIASSTGTSEPSKGQSLSRLSAYLLGATTAGFVLFQIHAVFASTDLSLNLADPLALLAFASVCIPILTRRELPKWESCTFNLSIALFGMALLVASIVGYSKVGMTAWAFAGRLTGYLVVIGYLCAGYLVVHRLGHLGFTIISRILGITASCITLLQVIFRSINLGFLPQSIKPTFEGFSANRNAFAFQLIIIACLLLPQLETRPRRLKSLTTNTAALGFCCAGVLLSGSRTGMIALGFIFATSLLLGISPVRNTVSSIVVSFSIVMPFYLALLLPEWTKKLRTEPLPGEVALLESAALGLSREWVPKWVPKWEPKWQPVWSDQSSDHLRFTSNILAIKDWVHNPILGTGLGTFIADSEKRLGMKMVIHNTPIWILCEFGAFGFSVFLYMAWAVSHHLFKRRAWQETPQRKALMLVLVAFGLFCQLHEVLYQRILWLALGISLTARSARLDLKQLSASAD